MFFKPRFYQKKQSTALFFTPDTALTVPACFATSYIEKTVKEKLPLFPGSCPVKSLTFSVGIPAALAAAVEKEIPLSGGEEAYAISLGEESFVYGASEKALLFGLSTLLQLAEYGELCPALLYDHPVCPVRGYRVYMPGRENIGIFKEMIDLLSYYKYNAIILEIGGAMEYKKHPEINAAWLDFCAEAHRYSARALEMQNGTHPWLKDSIHCDNGDGSYLTQEECRDIAAYCRERGLEVIPECPTLSHSDYLLLPHREFAERDNDNWPDTYCPSNPAVYDLVFDVLDEVISVFRPSRINIGHDEFYSMCICPRCQGKDPVDLYIGDIRKIRDYLAARGIGILMWGEKLLKTVDKHDGRHYGGWYDPVTYPDGTVFQVPDLYPCADRMPDGITYLHWYWAFGEEYDRVYHDRGYDVVFGNFNALECVNFPARVAAGCRGGFVSNWGSNEDEYMQRNGQYTSLIGTAYAFWCPDFSDKTRATVIERVMHEAYRRHYAGKKDLIRVCHTTDHKIPYKIFYDGVFIEDEVYMLGHYRLTYTDGTSVLFPVKYGTNISTSSTRPDGLGMPDYSGASAYYEVASATLPRMIGDRLYYECNYENPFPEKKAASFTYEPRAEKADITVLTESVLLPT